ncbi:phospho-N-acetylmuramoyl-pentapeptide-transferase [Erysipelothrix urinaevulpis]|uniref:phospho-N-acetylmuramoyl-pentapeptide- transferase n=1 Tax=Erysipelothrix urinaevulpis TaxID=2683717 RepID=UPI0013587FFF|nr:phospho-N-acetylmuramoyl-pentapeptide-transferase [Erysipelothrix urinaevulpis]
MLIGLLGLGISFVLGLLLYPRFIDFLQKNNVSQKPSEYALDEYKNKKPTVTFGGVLFVVIPVLVSLVMLLFQPEPMTLLIMVIFVLYAMIGLIDDYKIIKEGKNDGLKASKKFLYQLVLAVVFYFFYQLNGGKNILAVPFMENGIDLKWAYPLLVFFIMTGTSNAVNLTDGMDGLATGTMLIALIPFAYFAKIAQMTALFVFVLSVMGALLSFLVFNKKPAKIFMGDVGSLPLGALLAMIAIVLNKELLLAVIGGVFVFETITVIMQKISWKTRGKRIFKYTPIHYSFTLSGWKEKDVVLFFYALGLTFMLIGFGLSAIS